MADPEVLERNVFDDPDDGDYEEPPPPIWTRYRDEPPVAYMYFKNFCALGPQRNYKALAVVVGRANQTLRRHGYRWNWVARAQAFDEGHGLLSEDESLVQARLHELTEKIEMGGEPCTKEDMDAELYESVRRHAHIGKCFQQLAQISIERRLEKLMRNPADLGPDIRDIRRLAETGIRLERQALGAPDVTVVATVAEFNQTDAVSRVLTILGGAVEAQAVLDETDIEKVN